MKIFVIDDSELILKATTRMLEEAGFEVVARATAIGSSGLILRYRPDIVLLDVTMPGLQGDELVSLCRKHPTLRDVTFVLYSDRPEADLAKLAQQCGADGYVSKGLDTKELVQRITARASDKARLDPREGSPALGRGPASPPMHLLFVDDHSATLNSYRRAFGAGAFLDLAASGQEALAIIGSSQRPDIVVSDIFMPGMSGIQLYKEAVGLDPAWRKRFILVTGMLSAAYAQRASPELDPPILEKPLGYRRLTEVLQTLAVSPASAA